VDAATAESVAFLARNRAPREIRVDLGKNWLTS
jgi:hypothetical protein